jgi:hypothetical protein
MSEIQSLKGRSVLLSSHYLPCLEYFTCVTQAGSAVIESHENFQKQTLRNRCYVQAANGIEMLTVPVVKPAGKVPIRDVRIDYGQLWQKKHWRCLVSAYANSPFFEYYAPDFQKIYESRPDFLFDLNYEILTLCLHLLQTKVSLSYTLSYEAEPKYPVFDARSCINAKKNVNRYQFYYPHPYYQTFGNGFSDNLSIVDLLFNTGPEALEVLKKSAKDNQATLLNEL